MLRRIAPVLAVAIIMAVLASEAFATVTCAFSSPSALSCRADCDSDDTSGFTAVSVSLCDGGACPGGCTEEVIQSCGVGGVSCLINARGTAGGTSCTYTISLTDSNNTVNISWDNSTAGNTCSASGGGLPVTLTAFEVEDSSEDPEPAE